MIFSLIVRRAKCSLINDDLTAVGIEMRAQSPVDAVRSFLHQAATFGVDGGWLIEKERFRSLSERAEEGSYALRWPRTNFPTPPANVITYKKKITTERPFYILKL